MTRPADRALRVALAGILAAAAVEWVTGVAELWIAVASIGPVIGALGQWCLTREFEDTR